MDQENKLFRSSITNEELFQKLKERNHKVLADHRDSLDELFLPVLDALNQHPNIATVYSCSGHPEVDSTRL